MVIQPLYAPVSVYDYHVPRSHGRYYTILDLAFMQEYQLTPAEFDGEDTDDDDDEDDGEEDERADSEEAEGGDDENDEDEASADDSEEEAEGLGSQISATAISPQLQELLTAMQLDVRRLYHFRFFTLAQRTAINRAFVRFRALLLKVLHSPTFGSVVVQYRQAVIDQLRPQSPAMANVILGLPAVMETFYGWRFNGEDGSAFVVDRHSVWLIQPCRRGMAPRRARFSHQQFKIVASVLASMQQGSEFVEDKALNAIRLQSARMNCRNIRDPGG